MSDFDIYWYNSLSVIDKNINLIDCPGYNLYRDFHKIFAQNFSLTDRYGIIKLPIETKTASMCQPVSFKEFKKDLQELCEERARSLIQKAKETNKKLFIMYSGGIDSTLILSSFILSCTKKEINDHVVIGLTDYSIRENPTFFKNIMIKNFNMVSAYLFQSYLGNDQYIFITGENCDQLFGSEIIKELVNFSKNSNIINSKIDQGILIDFFNTKINSIKNSESIVKILNQIILASPVDISTFYNYFWWINFHIKWQSVYMRILSYTNNRNLNSLKPEDNYTTFYNTDEFQLWSLNNSNQLIKDTWSSYKFICKDIIYKVNPDDNYKNKKEKWGSLISVVRSKHPANLIFSDFQMEHNSINKRFWNNDNIFYHVSNT